jgi:hypothetical protein
MNELFEARKPALLALPADVLLRPRISRERASPLTKVLKREFAPLLPRLSPITKADLDKAAADATELLQIVDASDEAVTGSPRDLRRRAYTAWRRGYTEIFHPGRYLGMDYRMRGMLA